MTQTVNMYDSVPKLKTRPNSWCRSLRPWRICSQQGDSESTPITILLCCPDDQMPWIRIHSTDNENRSRGESMDEGMVSFIYFSLSIADKPRGPCGDRDSQLFRFVHQKRPKQD